MDDRTRKMTRAARMPAPSKRLWKRMAVAAHEVLQLYGLVGEGELEDQPEDVREALLASMRSVHATMAALDSEPWEPVEPRRWTTPIPPPSAALFHLMAVAAYEHLQAAGQQVKEQPFTETQAARDAWLGAMRSAYRTMAKRGGSRCG